MSDKTCSKLKRIVYSKGRGAGCGERKIKRRDDLV